MNALVPAICSNLAQTAAKTALSRRIEPCARTGGDRQDAHNGQRAHARPLAPVRPAQPVTALVAHILGARSGAANASGYGAYETAARLLELDSRVLDITLG